jgi:hypothetical protein
MGVSEQRDMRVLEKKIWWWADQNGTCHQQKKKKKKKKKKKPLWDAPQLIYMNHNRCPSFWKKLVSKMLTNKMKN